jgi:hypothetical protein
MWQVEEERRGEGQEPTKYFGKWPFLRVGGMQELASTLFSLGNLLPHARALVARRDVVAPRELPRRAAVLAFSGMGVLTWAFSAAFHARDVWVRASDIRGFVCFFVCVLGDMWSKATVIRVYMHVGRPWEREREGEGEGESGREGEERGGGKCVKHAIVTTPSPSRRRTSSQITRTICARPKNRGPPLYSGARLCRAEHGWLFVWLFFRAMVTQWTERLDYHFALLLLGTSVLLGLLRSTSLWGRRDGGGRVAALATLVYSPIAVHIWYLNAVKFDYGVWRWHFPLRAPTPNFLLNPTAPQLHRGGVCPAQLPTLILHRCKFFFF